MADESSAAPPGIPSAATEASDDTDPRTRILRKGDLARVQEAPRSRLKGRNNHLVKITRSTPVPQEELDSLPDYADPLERHAFVYDVEFVLGGKLGGIRRHELIYTTATAEGMISEGGRSQRRRKPSVAVLEQQETTASKPLKKKTYTKKVIKGSGAGAKRKATGKGGGADAKRARGHVVASEATIEAGSRAELYTKHRREFERMATRLEKVDQFGFFFDEPPALEEPEALKSAPPTQQLKHADGKSSSVLATSKNDAEVSALATEMTPAAAQVSHHTNCAPSISPGPAAASSRDAQPSPAESACNNATNTDPGSPQPVPPAVPAVVDLFSKPARTWYDIRKRREAGRYELDRVKRSDEQRRKRLKPYVSWKRHERKKGNWKDQPQQPKRIRKKGSGHPRVLHPKGVNWDLFRDDVHAMCDDGLTRDEESGNGGSGTIGHSAKKIRDELDKIYQRTAKRQFSEMETADSFHEFSLAIKGTKNGEAAMQGKWRTTPFPERLYERLSSDVICAGLSAVDAITSSYEMRTTLDNRFVGISYRYNDTGQSEGWMKSVIDESMNGGGGSAKMERRTSEALRNDSGVVKAQCRATMQTLLMAVEDKVLTEAGILQSRELRSANWQGNGPDDLGSEDGDNMQIDDNVEPELVEQSVWGIDCYTRKNVLICLETEFESSLALEFIEKWLLPAMNACPEDLAHDLSNAAKLLAGMKLREASAAENGVDRDEQWSHSLIGQALLAKIRATAPPWLKPAANQLLRAIEALGLDFFRVHPKGHGSIVLSQKLKANTLVTFYRGEVYPSWRWGEKMDAIDMTQERLGLRPTLPDFYNMSLERPQSDPRGYGLMIVDGSRKAGHGSMLSHSCQPTCEVRVAALDGELCLAMTTLRALEQGEELTFDYNAVTESVNEYRAAVCLCGFGGCRGSFLHFATADCYQQVLNRNSPIAVRFSNLVKGCMKQVMSSDDDEVLRNHGFGTAAFGAVSLNRHLPLGQTNGRRDSMDCVPIWLRTFVADTLRYIEYERRALPISLLCEHVEKNGTTKATNEKSKPQAAKKKSAVRDKPENVFMFYARKKKEHFEAMHPMEKGENGGPRAPMAGISHRHEVLRLAAVAWKALPKEEKEKWKEMSIKEWQEKKKSGVVAEERKPSKSKQKDEKKSEPKDKKDESNEKKGDFNFSKISFEAADAEGVSAMEQRVQQLTQALSRVGRVLDRHRESTLAATGFLSATSQIHAPISILPPERVVSWLWHDQSGPVQSLLEAIGSLECAGESLRRDFHTIQLRYKDTFDSYKPLSDRLAEKHKVAPSEAKESLTLALLEMRQSIQSYLVDFVSDKKKHDAAKARFRREANKMRKEALDDSDENSGDGEPDTLSVLASAATDAPKMPIMDPRLAYFEDRWKLEAAADLLLFYAHTSTFLTVNPYNRLESTPVEVYARELGNAVPKSLIENSSDGNESNNVVIVARESDEERTLSDDDEQASQSSNRSARSRSPKNLTRPKNELLCEPDDVITNVTVAYEGDYVLAQLLQWYNGGIGQKPGLPDMVGCAVLPAMRGCFSSPSPKGQKTKSETFYASDLRPMLATWLEDPHQRGSPFPEELRIAFANELKPNERFPIGSPVLDLLIMGDDSNMQLVTAALSENIDSSNSIKLDPDKAKNEKTKTAKERLQGTVDEGMPAQAVANWVQCENPKCLKWRKLPWHVDLDLLPEKFFCKDNKWNPKAASCDSQEDAWDEGDAQAAPNGKGPADANINGVRDAEICVGAKFDIYRPNKKKYAAAEVIQVTRVGAVRRVRVHYAKTPERFDEWLVLPSDRIFPYMSRAIKDDKKETSLTVDDDSGEAHKSSSKKTDVKDLRSETVVSAPVPVASLSSPPIPKEPGIPRRPSMIPVGATPSADDIRPVKREPVRAPESHPRPPNPTQEPPATDIPRKKKLKTKHHDVPRKSKSSGEHKERKGIKKKKKSSANPQKKGPEVSKPAAPRPGSIPRKSAGESPEKPRPTSLLSSMMAPPAATGAKGDGSRPPKQKKPKHSSNKMNRNGGTVPRRPVAAGDGKQQEHNADGHSSDVQMGGGDGDDRKLQYPTTRRSPSAESKQTRSHETKPQSDGDEAPGGRYASLAAPRRAKASEARDNRARLSDYHAADGPKRSSLSSEARATRAPASDYRYDSYGGERSYPPGSESYAQYYGSHQYDSENRHYDDYTATESRHYDDYGGSDGRYYNDYGDYGGYNNGRNNGHYYDNYEKPHRAGGEYEYGSSRSYNGSHRHYREDNQSEHYDGEYGSSGWDSSKSHSRSRHERKHR